MNALDFDRLTAQLTRLPVERQAEVLDFVQFLLQKEQEQQQLTQAAAQLSGPSLAAVWDNPEDAVYDQL